jgi:hypothetical protein
LNRKRTCEVYSDTYGENFPSTNLKCPVSYICTGFPSHI